MNSKPRSSQQDVNAKWGISDTVPFVDGLIKTKGDEADEP